ncbi:Protein aurora borealis [Pseudolycoriella hygida]|uniref:Protein aurora borealis n=1 Tax=Pseudolycoriella hygida TaxID=35572 RepID=A0A9Q0S5D8_9DIPT|nr:Protein aurora borealis [Pseudolycoriella hygida]
MDTNLSLTPKQIKVRSTCSPMEFINGRKSINIGKSTPNSFHRHSNKFSMYKNVLGTPSPRLSKVINPFEVGLTERLHRPIICSPSLFHRPSTPQLSSTHFEWTIDEISSLNPANFEAHETQFTSETDPDVEAKAQDAISTFFREQIIVPSPVDCPLRNQKITLLNESFRKNTRDGICQTELSLPPQLPKEIEDLLKPYFSQTMNQQQSPVYDCDTTIDHDARDASLRRKLFRDSESSCSSEIADEIELDCSSPPPCSPQLRNNGSQLMKSEGVNDDNDKSFGYLSPINLTPVKVQTTSSHNWSCESMKSIYNSTPERSISHYLATSSDSVKMLNVMEDRKAKPYEENGTTEEMDFSTASMVDDDRQLLSYIQTPTRRRDRYSSRKNLSRSFLCVDEVDETAQSGDDGNILSKTDSGFSDTEDKRSSESKWAAKHSIQAISDHMEIDSTTTPNSECKTLIVTGRMICRREKLYLATTPPKIANTLATIATSPKIPCQVAK